MKVNLPLLLIKIKYLIQRTPWNVAMQIKEIFKTV